ncbi:MAG: hypothetical protein ACLVAW_19125 [Eisenbergiella massiliensis]
MIKTVLVKKLPEESGAACEERPLSGKTEEDRRSSARIRREKAETSDG